MSKKETFSVVRSGMTVASITVFGKVVSFMRDMLLARYYGATAESDIVLASTSLVLILSSFITSSFAASYLPIATDNYLLKGERDKDTFFGSIYGAATIAGLLIALVELFFMDVIIRLFMPGFSEEEYAVLKKMMIIQIPVVLFSFLGVVNNGNLKMLNKFGLSEIPNLIVVGGFTIYLIVFKNSLPVYGMAVCISAVYILSFAFGFVAVYKSGIISKWIFTLKESGKSFRPIVRAMIPFMIASGAKEVNILLDKAIASLLGEGNITMQSYASKMTVTEVGMIATAISVVIFSQAAKYNSLHEGERLSSLVEAGLSFVNTLMLPCCIFTIVLRNEIISVLFGHGAFTGQNVFVTANTMMIYAIGMLGAGIEEVLLNTMYATKHRKYPMVVNVVAIAINFALNLLVYKRFGIYGLAAASSLVALLKVPCYVIYTNSRIVKIRYNNRKWISTIGTIMASVLAGVLMTFLKKEVAKIVDKDLPILLVTGLVGVLVFFVLLVFFGNEYARAVKDKVFRKNAVDLE